MAAPGPSAPALTCPHWEAQHVNKTEDANKQTNKKKTHEKRTTNICTTTTHNTQPNVQINILINNEITMYTCKRR